MRISLDTANAFLAQLIAGTDVADFPALLDRLDAPIYMTDALGFITYFNAACIGFTGRTPAVGKDRWCVTWKLFTTDGEPLPHEICPMAQTIIRGRQSRGAVAIAARPDGTRVRFTPFPTPLFNRAGKQIGAINILIEVSDVRQALALYAQADQCRRLVASTTDPQAVKALRAMADECEAEAEKLAETFGIPSSLNEHS